MKKVYVFDTEEEAILCEQVCYDNHLKLEPDEDKRATIALTTTKWCNVEQREDGKWAVGYCEAYGNPENYPIEEI